MATENKSEAKSRTWGDFLAHEMSEFIFNFLFLALFLVAFAWYRRLVLASYHIQYLSYWMPIFEAAILAKVIMIGDALRLGQRFRNRPLALVTLYRAVVFSLFVGLFSVLEHILEALIHGKSMVEGISALTEKGTDELMGSFVMVLVAFIPFFAMKEIERVFGADKVRELFFRRGTGDPRSSPKGNG